MKKRKSTMAKTPLGPVLQRYFCDYLIGQRDLSPRTIESYRDTFRLLLDFWERCYRIKPDDVCVEDLVVSMDLCPKKSAICLSVAPAPSIRLARLRRSTCVPPTRLRNPAWLARRNTTCQTPLRVIGLPNGAKCRTNTAVDMHAGRPYRR